MKKIDCDLYPYEKSPKRCCELEYLLAIGFIKRKRFGGYQRKVRFAVQTHSEAVRKR